MTKLVNKAIQEAPPDKRKELSEKDIERMAEFDKRIKRAEEKIKKLNATLPGMGSIGDFIQRDFATAFLRPIHGMMGGPTPIDIDFITGKRKTLSSALYDVSKERGIETEGILYLIKSLPDLESFLYSTSVKKYYRDHTEHQLRVAVLGDFLMELDMEQGELLKIISDLTEIDKKEIKEKTWWIMGLLHDTGYPLSKLTTAVNWSLINQILRCYPNLDLEVNTLEVNLARRGKKLKDYISILEKGLSKEAKKLIREGAGLSSDLTNINGTNVFLSGKNGHDEFDYKSVIELDHGVLGGLNMLINLGTPQEIKEKEDEYRGYILAAKAIALHNFKANLPDFKFEKNPLAFLLIFLDEMQEWGRPIPVQIKDTYFTTELKKTSLLDEVLLVTDDNNWMMQYKNGEAKNLVNFDFKKVCTDKRTTIGRLRRGKQFPGTNIILQDYESGAVSEEPKNEMQPWSRDMNVQKKLRDQFEIKL